MLKYFHFLLYMNNTCMLYLESGRNGRIKYREFGNQFQIHQIIDKVNKTFNKKFLKREVIRNENGMIFYNKTTEFNYYIDEILGCYKTRYFGDYIIIINKNKLKEFISKNTYNISLISNDDYFTIKQQFNNNKLHIDMFIFGLDLISKLLF